MNSNRSLSFLAFSLFTQLLFQQVSIAQQYTVKTTTDTNGYTYEFVTNDPAGLRIYTLENGLKVYLAQNFDQPRIYSLITVKAGSTYDPKENTGVAHYLEHMMFKGTDQIGTLNWEKEKHYLEKISDLFEKHRVESDQEKKKRIYSHIDSLSYEASKYAIAREYRDLGKSIGAVLVNGITNVEETIYQALIPKTTLHKFLLLESERFSKMVPRLFHTELETVYEEFNRESDNVEERKRLAISQELFKKHPYGQDVIGSLSHLKNPSIKAVEDYFQKYYVPNNMALILTGDLRFEETIKLVDETFGKLQPAMIETPNFPKEEPIQNIRESQVIGPNEESVYIGFKFNGAGSNDEKFITLINLLLNNGRAGLFDTDLNTNQQVKNAKSFIDINNDYSVHYLDGYPNDGQSLEQVRDLMLEQLERIKQGDFEEWLIQAVINELRKKEIEELSGIFSGAEIYKSFIRSESWDNRIRFLDELETITKDEIQTFVQNNYGDNYAIIFKRKGEPSTTKNITAPKITPIVDNAEEISDFAESFQDIKSGSMQPEFVDFEEEISLLKLNNGLLLNYVNNTQNDLFELNVIFDIGKDNHKKLALAAEFVTYMGTRKYSVDELNRELYKLGMDFTVNVENDRILFRLEGLEKDLEKGVKLLNHIFEEATSDKKTLESYIEGIIQDRNDRKSNASSIRNALILYALDGKDSRTRNVIPKQELLDTKLDEIVSNVHGIRNYPHRIFYYGSNPEKAKKAIETYYRVDGFSEMPPERERQYEKQVVKPIVYFIHYDMVQAQIAIVNRGKKFELESLPYTNILNFYLGDVFQNEIREKRSLAYSASAVYFDPSYAEDRGYFYMYAGTQADKVPNTLGTMIEIINQLPTSESQFRLIKEDLLKRYQAERIRGANLFWYFEDMKKLGLDYDVREYKYNKIKDLELYELEEFFYSYVRDRGYSIVMVGDKEKIDLKAVERFAEVEILDIESIFGY